MPELTVSSIKMIKVDSELKDIPTFSTARSEADERWKDLKEVQTIT